ncbi:MAG: type II toxin-antitoxin system VapC family toxin [bacterium]
MNDALLTKLKFDTFFLEMKRIYIETSVISFLTARPSKDVVLAGHQASTHIFWKSKNAYELFISDMVIQECEKGDADCAQSRIQAITGLPVLNVDKEVERLASELIRRNAIPKNSVEDAVHIAVASVSAIDFIVTWNFKHINNPFMKQQIRAVIINQGYTMPEICSPEELLEANDE